jgi:hypothetical protein
VPDNNDIQSILEDLRTVLSDLTGEEKAEVEKKLGAVQKPAVTPAPAQQAQPQPQQQPVMPQVQPVIPVQVQQQPPVQSIPVPPPVQVQQPVIQPQPAQSTPVQVQPPPIQVRSPIPPTTAPAPVPAPVRTTTPTPAARPVSTDDEDVKQIDYALIYPVNMEFTKEAFLHNMTEIVMKSIKKKVAIQDVYEKAFHEGTNWDETLEEIKLKPVKAVFLIYNKDNCPNLDILTEKFSKLSVMFQPIIDAKLNSKIAYIDLAIELMLHRK